MKALQPLVLMTGFVLAGCGSKDESPKPSGSSGNPVTAPADYLGAAAKAKGSADTAVTAAGLNQTIKLFYAQEGRFPKDLNELVRPEYLNQLPAPPTGLKYDYNPANGVVKIVPK